jgi:HSP20 family molecular chaperone IbpA|tara:strand:+ start:343 stop:660 length:318 start_codon:yes stop_codon:yes gene_type:complete
MYYSLLNLITDSLGEYNGGLGHDSVSSKGDVYVAKVVLPGIKKKQISIKTNQDYLRVNVDDKLHQKIKLANLVDTSSIKSKLEDGILEITLPKKEVSESIDIKIE